MEILLVERDRLIRDQVKVGLQQFPEFTVTCGEGYGGLSELRQRDYAVVFLGVPSSVQEAKRLIEHMRGIDKKTDLVVLAPDQLARDLQADKARYDIWSFLTTPVSIGDFFRMIARLRERLTESVDGTRAASKSSRATRTTG
jgi:DNA-binding NtrC family response regulator